MGSLPTASAHKTCPHRLIGEDIDFVNQKSQFEFECGLKYNKMEENLKYDPDKVVPNKNTLTYPVQIGDQKIVLFDNTPFIKRGLTDLEHYYNTRLQEIKKEYDILYESYQINKRIYSSIFKFEPIVGNIYYLYENLSGEEFLSMIKPNEWSYKCFGSFRLNAERRWEQIT